MNYNKSSISLMILKFKPVFILFGFVLFASCKKSQGITDNHNQPGPAAPAIRLKDVVITGLPSPYYHFEYDAALQVTFVSFASDYARYDVLYSGGRIFEIRNNIPQNKDRLQYAYNSSGMVELITYADSTGSVYKAVNLIYDGQKLIRLSRAAKSGAGLVPEKTIVMSYYPDGNLMDIAYHYLPTNGQTEAAYTSHFEQYDSKVNIDDFNLIHNEFFDHFYLLPGIRLHKNNPGKETRTGDGANYTVYYTYTYNDKNVPIIRKGDLVYTSGPEAGQKYSVNSFYSYY